MGRDIFDVKDIGKFKIGSTKGLGKAIGTGKIADMPLSDVKAGKIGEISKKGIKNVTSKKRSLLGIGRKQGKKLGKIAKSGRV